jgi:NAD(P)H-hydrate epimerase
MIPVISKSQAYDADIASVSGGYISEKQLISNAAMSIYRHSASLIDDIEDRKFLFVIGKGNNGVDGIEAHKIFKNNNIFSSLFFMEDTIVEIEKHNIDLEDVIASSNPDFSQYDFIIDGLLGIGTKGNLKSSYFDIINKINRSKRSVISIDMPSGIYADNGIDAGTSIKADYTITMGFPKKGLYFNKGKENSGHISIADIGYPDKVKNFKSKIFLIEKDDIVCRIKKKLKNLDKYSRGRLGTLVGSKKYSGAAVLAIKSAVESGAGIVKSMLPESIRLIIDTNSIESISVSFDDKKLGFLSKKPELIYSKKLVENTDCLLVGSGLDEDLRSINFVSKVISFDCKRLVLDGSGLLCLSNRILKIEDLPKNTILTPHYREFSNIFKINIDQIVLDPIDSVLSIVQHLEGRVLILKGPTTIIVNSFGELLILSNGNEVLSTAGTGDVLAGIVSSLLSQGYNLNDSAIIGTWIHSEASSFYVKENGEYGLTAYKLIDWISKTFNSI